MRIRTHAGVSMFVLALGAAVVTAPRAAAAADAAEINRDADQALALLYQQVPEAQRLAARAKGILIFPDVVRAGFIFGAQRGEGVLRKQGKTVAYYRTSAASYGLQAGAQTFGYAMFFMTDSALEYLDKSNGWEIGVGPSVVVVDTGKARTLTTSTLQSDIYAFIFSQKGLMAGLGLQGSKITKIDR